MKEAYAKYYATNRDALLARMRERYAKKREQLTETEGEDALNALREKTHEKYVRHKENQSLAVLRTTAEKPILRPTAKAFIETELIRSETYKKMPLSAVRALCSALESH